jgi:Rieske 2Fe-2S family protein
MTKLSGAPGGDWIDRLCASQRPGHSLDQAFYRDPAIFERDVERVLCNHWIMAGHVSQLPATGDYVLFDVGGESVILVRDAKGAIRAHYNVCRHRGSRVLLDCTGHASSLVCRYHGWTYALDGSLKAARHMPEDFDARTHGLVPCHVRVIEGLIFVSLADEAPDLGPVADGVAPFLRLHGTAAARVAERRTFAVHANWKLVVENYLECYHCRTAHPEYCRVEIKVDRIGDSSPAAQARFDAREREWSARAERLGTVLPEFGTTLPLDERLPRAQFGAAYRAPLRESYLTATADGQPAAPLMGGFTDYDGGETALAVGPFTYMLAANDHAVFFQFVPRDAEHTDMILTWLVDGAARAGEDYDLARLTRLWSVTTEQDKSIVEANAAGVRSRRYAPGPPSLLEGDVAGFRAWYLALVGPRERLRHLSRSGSARYFSM